MARTGGRGATVKKRFLKEEETLWKREIMSAIRWSENRFNRGGKMDIYSEYADKGRDVLLLEDAETLFKSIKGSINKNDEDECHFYEDMLKKAVKYANRRGSWKLLTNEEKMDTDDLRTTEHSAFIRSLDILARLLKKNGKDTSWRDILGDK